MHKRTVLSVAILSMLVAPVFAQKNQTGSVNFNVSNSPVPGAPSQPVSLYGCNNTIINTHLSWNLADQIIGSIPYGYRKTASGKTYYVAKYYIASPQVLRKNRNEDPYLGLVMPDRFTFHGNNPTQAVKLNYQIFKPTHLAQIPTDFHYKYNGTSCSSQKVNFIPINTQCRDLPWGSGLFSGAGIGLLSENPTSNAFLPMLGKNKKPAQCTVTILDDIILDHQVYFASKTGKTKTVNLTQLYKKSEPVRLICIPRTPADVPAGCVAHSTN